MYNTVYEFNEIIVCLYFLEFFFKIKYLIVKLYCWGISRYRNIYTRLCG